MSKYKKIPLPEKGEGAYVIVDEDEKDIPHLGLFFNGKEVWINNNYQNKPYDNLKELFPNLSGLIATYGFHLEGIPVILDDVNNLAKNYAATSYAKADKQSDEDAAYIQNVSFYSFISGYQSHAATNPFSSSDMCRFVEWRDANYDFLGNGIYSPMYELKHIKIEELLTIYLSQPRYLSDEEVEKLFKK